MKIEQQAPDPQAVRDLAREHIRSGRPDIGTTIIKHFGNGVLSDEEFFAWGYAVHEAWRNELRTVSWPAERPHDGEPRSCPDSHSPWSEWLTRQMLDREWLASDLAKASGHVFDVEQVSRWLHSQDVPEPWAAVLVAKALDASAIDALRAAEHGVVVDAVLESGLESAYRKGWTDCGIHARRETDSMLEEMARDFTETGRRKRAYIDAQFAALEARDAKVGGSDG